VSCWASEGRLKAANLFFRHHYGVKPLPPDIKAETAELANGVANPLE
jgi:hypothetical protein